jgi:hypothetical protein
MQQDSDPGRFRRELSPERQRQRRRLPAGVFSFLFGLFIAGGLYSGYIFISTVASLLAGQPANPPLFNPFQPAAKGTPQAGEQITALPDWRGSERLNILLLGIDQREDERGQPTRSTSRAAARRWPRRRSRPPLVCACTTMRASTSPASRSSLTPSAG